MPDSSRSIQLLCCLFAYVTNVVVKTKLKSISTPSSLTSSSHVIFTDSKLKTGCFQMFFFPNSNCLKPFGIRLHTIKRKPVYKIFFYSRCKTLTCSLKSG